VSQLYTCIIQNFTTAMTDKPATIKTSPDEPPLPPTSMLQSHGLFVESDEPITGHHTRGNTHTDNVGPEGWEASNTFSSQTEEHPAFEHAPGQQETFISELIHTLQTTKVDYHAAYTNASTHLVEPVNSSEVNPEIYKTPTRSRRSSAHSRYSSKRLKIGTLSQMPLHRPAGSLESSVSHQARRDELLPESPKTSTYPSTARLTLILISLYIAIFLVALDRTIIGPAIPEITNQFNSISDIGWYGSAYMLTSCGFILLYGRVYTFFSTKIVFLTSIALFEIGSVVCGAASSSLILIIGRAIAGFGSSGIFTGAILIILEIVPLHRRPLLQGLFGACFGIASVAGPLLGGAFTSSKATWRWCFFLNIPLGAFTSGVVVLFLHLSSTKPRPKDWKEMVMKLDPLGTVLFLPSVTCLLLALQWGAVDYPWNDPKIIALFAVFSVLLVAFIVWQYYTRDTTATVPTRILFQRSVAFGSLSQFAVGATMLTVSQYIPLWFQAIKDVSAIESGIRVIPLVLSVVFGSIVSGGLVQRIGYYTPFMVFGSVLMSVGAGLLTTWAPDIVTRTWIGYQIILGLGVGFTMQHPNLAIQVVLPKPDIPTGTALLSLAQTLGGAIFVAVGQNTFINKFAAGLSSVPGVDAQMAVHAGATELKNIVHVGLMGRVLEVYNSSLTKGPFFACMIVACLTVPAALGMEWRSVKEGMGLPAQKTASQNTETVPPLEKKVPR
jgi:EmrB/QacA subfamily drug resistance transporter